MKRSSTYLLIHECIWRHTFRKQSPERLDVVLACGIVYGPGCHRVGPEKRAAQVRRYMDGPAKTGSQRPRNSGARCCGPPGSGLRSARYGLFASILLPLSAVP